MHALLGRTFALALVALPLLACQPYAAGSFKAGLAAFPEQRSSRGCLDIGIRAALDSAAEGPVLDVYLGNRCNEAVWVDFSRLEVDAGLPSGEEIPVGIYDPKRELRAALLGGRESVVERLELEAPLEAVSLCATLDALVASQASGPPHILCAAVEG